MAEIREKVFMAGNLQFTEEEMEVDDNLGYPRVYARLCQGATTHRHGPPSTFLPYALQPHEAARVREFSRIFPIVNPEATPTANPRTFINVLWKQLNHLGNAGFDPDLFRVDPYGNVLYFHADPASPLFWDIDHWFPCARGGRTVLSNLRLLQWQVRKKKHSKLEFLVPWWDMQLGISANQFLCVFASRNSDFRKRGFSFLFELNESEMADSHQFPPSYLERKSRSGLAPAALASAQRFSCGPSRNPLVHKSRSPSPGGEFQDDRKGFGKTIQRSWPSMSKENDDPNICGDDGNAYLSIALARDSLRKSEESKKRRAEMRGLEDELGDLRRKNEVERIEIQDLEAALIGKRRRVEKCRRLAEAQASFKAQLEKMIRDAMHQSVVYKEQVRLNQAACNTLVARLEAQKAVLDAAEQELIKKYSRRSELEKQIVVDDAGDHGRRKRRWWWADGAPPQEGGGCGSSINTGSTRRKMRRALRKELRVFLEEEQKASDAGVPFDGGFETESLTVCGNSDNGESAVNCKLEEVAIGEQGGGEGPASEEQQVAQLGKRNVERWLQILLNEAEDGGRDDISPERKSGDLVPELNTAVTNNNPREEEEKIIFKGPRLKPSAASVQSDSGRQSASSSCRETESIIGRRTERRRGAVVWRPDSPRAATAAPTSRRFPPSPLMMPRD